MTGSSIIPAVRDQIAARARSGRLSALRPYTRTAVAYREAVAEIDTKILEFEASIVADQQARQKFIGSGAVSEEAVEQRLDELETRIFENSKFLARIKDLRTILLTDLPDLEAREKREAEAITKKIAELHNLATTHTARALAEYPAAAAIIAALAHESGAIVRLHEEITRAARSVGLPQPDLSGCSFGYSVSRADEPFQRSLQALVALPALVPPNAEVPPWLHRPPEIPDPTLLIREQILTSQAYEQGFAAGQQAEQAAAPARGRAR